MRIVVPLLMLPLLALVMPLAFALAWLHEALADARCPASVSIRRR